MEGMQKALGQAIARARRRRGFTQPQVAEASGVPQPTLSKIENGRQSVDADGLYAIATAIGVGVAEIWADVAPQGAAVRKAEPKVRPIARNRDDLKLFRHLSLAILSTMAEKIPGAADELLEQVGDEEAPQGSSPAFHEALLELLRSRVAAGKPAAPPIRKRQSR